MLPLLILGAAGAYAAYEYFGKKAPAAGASSATSPAQAIAHALSGTVPQLVLSHSAAPAVTPAVPEAGATVSDPVVAAASMAANALLHGSATDPSVQSVVAAFQAAAGGLTVDGKYGPLTEAALKRYVPNAPSAPAVYGGP